MITYHFGKAILNEVANEKASEECPEGNDGLPPLASFSMNGYVT
jgi:hypothetical protein